MPLGRPVFPKICSRRSRASGRAAPFPGVTGTGAFGAADPLVRIAARIEVQEELDPVSGFN